MSLNNEPQSANADREHIQCSQYVNNRHAQCHRPATHVTIDARVGMCADHFRRLHPAARSLYGERR